MPGTTAATATATPCSRSTATDAASGQPERMKILALLAVVVLGVLADLAAARVRGVPPVVELDGCVMPAEACKAVREVVTMNVDDRKLDFAVEQLRIPGSAASPGKVLTELK